MKLFKLDRQISIVCEAENTRYGFRHIAHLFIGSYEIATSKACYHNRTWEAYQFQSVIEGVINKHWTDKKDRQKYLKKLRENYGK